MPNWCLETTSLQVLIHIYTHFHLFNEVFVVQDCGRLQIVIKVSHFPAVDVPSNFLTVLSKWRWQMEKKFDHTVFLSSHSRYLQITEKC
jgi:hypothetical protein